MPLSSVAIRRLITQGSIRIEPVSDAHFKQASYTFHLGNTFFAFPLDQAIDLDTGEMRREERLVPEGGYLLQPGEFIVGKIQERLALDSTVSCVLSVRGSCAQAGLNALNSDLFVEPNSDGHLSLAIKNTNAVPIRLRVGMKIVKGLFFRVEE